MVEESTVLDFNKCFLNGFTCRYIRGNSVEVAVCIVHSFAVKKVLVIRPHMGLLK